MSESGGPEQPLVPLDKDQKAPGIQGPLANKPNDNPTRTALKGLRGGGISERLKKKRKREEAEQQRQATKKAADLTRRLKERGYEWQ